MSKYIDADKLMAEIERLKEETPIGICEYDKGEENGRMEVLTSLRSTIISLQQVPPEGVQGTVHHYGGFVPYVVTNQEQLNARLRQFPNDAEVEIFIEARKEDTK